MVVAVSGGVDSGVAALLLRDAGHDVHAVFLRMWVGDDPRGCRSMPAEARAAELADHLKLPFSVLDLREEFEEQVVAPFVAAYLDGLTPNPCAVCNRFRFARLRAWAAGRGSEWVASGHYARLLHDEDGPWLLRGLDAAKDQSYVLARLAPTDLQALMLPLGGLTKREVREAARRAGLPSAEAAESQEVCFAVDGYRAFLRRRGVAPRPGRIVDESGAELGVHGGHWEFTVGQRRGLAVGGGKPLYVLERRAGRNEVVVGSRDRLTTIDVEVDELDERAVALWDGLRTADDCGGPWAAGDPDDGRPVPAGDRTIAVQLRYRSPAVAVAAVHDSVGGRLRLRLARPFSAAAPGQTAVFYRADRVVGSGCIATPPNESAGDGVIPFESRSTEPDDSLRTHGGQTC